MTKRFQNMADLRVCIKDDAFRYGASSWLQRMKLYLTIIGFRYSVWMRIDCFLRERKWCLPLHVLAFLRLQHVDHNSGIQIPAATQIGNGFYIGHHGTIVVNGGTVIGRNVNISQGVTLGQANRGEHKGVPTIGDNVYISPGAKIIGAVKVGNNVAIGANAVVTHDVPDNACVAGVPARIISMDGSEGYVNRKV